MPYIQEQDRDQLEDGAIITTAGELQYQIAELIAQYMSNMPVRYQTMNDVMGALNGANLEFYRRVVAPYEDKCIEKNGDVTYGKYDTTRGQ
jgi:hypothetical protein